MFNSEIQPCFYKAYINFPVEFMHFSSDSISSAGCSSSYSAILLALSAVLHSTTSAILLSVKFFVVDAF